MPPASNADWSLAQPGGTGTTVVAGRFPPIPAPATLWQVRFFDNGVLAGTMNSPGTTINLGVFTIGHTITGQMQWLLAAGVPASEYTPLLSYVVI